MDKIKAVIFDLDDTLLDTTGQIKLRALRNAVKAMVKEGLCCKEDEGFEAIMEIVERNPSADKFKELAKKFSCPKAEEAGKKEYFNIKIEKLEPYPKAIETLKELKKKYDLALVTTGAEKLQNEKIDILGIREMFDTIIINKRETKEEKFAKAIKKLGVNPQRVMCIGDRIDVDVKAANKLGMISVRILKGGYSKQKPKHKIEEPDYNIKELSEIPKIISKIQKLEDKLTKGPKIVVIGGGTGSPTLLEGLKQYSHNLSAIVTITDRGRSSGMIHKELNVLPPGDVRNNIIALSDSEKMLHTLFQYRFEEGMLKGHSVGNILIAALTKITGNFQKAIKETSKILNLSGGVYPSTLEDTNICAELEDGTVLKNEQEIVIKGEKIETFKRAKIKKAFLNPENAPANPWAIEAIEDADLIAIGPGSLFTSVIPNLLVKGICEAIKKSKAKKAYICNIVTQPGQTDGYKASDHIKQIIKYLGKEVLDYAIVNSEVPDKSLLEQYEKEKAFLVENDKEEIKKEGVKEIEDNLIENINEKKLLWEKQALLRHDSERIAEILVRIAANSSK